MTYMGTKIKTTTASSSKIMESICKVLRETKYQFKILYSQTISFKTEVTQTFSVKRTGELIAGSLAVPNAPALLGCK